MPSSQKVVLITGTSSGFGLLTAAHLVSQGHTVYATMRDLRKQDALLKAVGQAKGTLHILSLDVTDKDSIVRVAEQLAEKEGGLDGLVNNAGYGIGGFFEDLTEQEIRQQMEVNFFGVQNVTRRMIPLMRGRKRSTIINISSIAGRNANPAFGAYNASKFALEGFSESLYHELKPFGIRVCLIEPGTYKTNIFFDNAHYAQNFDNPQSPYYARSQQLKQRVLTYVRNCKKDPQRIADLVERLINADHPPFRSLPDWECRTLLGIKQILPFRVYAFLIDYFLQKK